MKKGFYNAIVEVEKKSSARYQYCTNTTSSCCFSCANKYNISRSVSLKTL